ncbi:hypothetical protein [Ferribacterium limneticum]|uniref:hypothetical protein n=1 Tax=Ferribacterium limneticum TaxID=76259 RepID=UPI001CFACD8B|nr:hypothetical protein [Ferribacterium limneticum]UCV29700.1 hypothetical protein KI617_06330 [Ferribacterium limneticum]UCV33619.1 hypothetical protein KI608_06330 [Ferribacterium limneticum]
MTDAQLKEAVLGPWPFFGVSSRGEVFARYVPSGPVFRWSWNQMIPMPVQGSDLVWLLHAQGEEDQSSDTEAAKRPAGKAK